MPVTRSSDVSGVPLHDVARALLTEQSDGRGNLRTVTPSGRAQEALRELGETAALPNNYSALVLRLNARLGAARAEMGDLVPLCPLALLTLLVGRATAR